MSKRKYTDEQKQHARRLLLIHNGDVGTVHQLTNIPKRTLYDWRTTWDDQYDLFFEAFAQKVIAYADANQRTLTTPNPITTTPDESAQPPDDFAQFTHLRTILMEHVMTLAHNLLLGEGYVSHRVIALTRLIDRIIQLDQILPDHNPEKVIRIEYLYDGSIHKTPPWENDPENNITIDNNTHPDT